MPGKLDNQVYIPTGDPKTHVQSANTGGGGPFQADQEIGKVYTAPDGSRWQKVKADATLTRAPVAKDVWYWKDVTTMEATSDIGDSQSGRNGVAGVTPSGATIATGSQRFWLLQEDDQVTLNGAAVNFAAVGGSLIADATGGLVNYVAPGTASTYVAIGFVHTAVDRSGGAGDVVGDINIASRLY